MTMTSDQLQRAAAFFSRHEQFLGHSLEAYRRREGLSEEALAARLGCHLRALRNACLCFRPRDAGDVAAIAEEFDLDACALAQVLDG